MIYFILKVSMDYFLKFLLKIFYLLPVLNFTTARNESNN